MKIIIIVISMLIAVSVFLFGLELANYNKIAWGIKIIGIKIGGLGQNQAEIILNQQLSQLKTKNINLVSEQPEKNWTASLEELGVEFNAKETVQNAYKIGRSENIFTGLFQQIAVFFQQPNLPLIVTVNPTILNNFADKNFIDIENKAISATLIYNNKKDDFEITPFADGKIIDRDKIKKELISQVSNLTLSPIRLQIIEDKPKVNAQEAEITRGKALNILNNAPYFLVYQDKKWPIEKQTLLDWIGFKVQDIGNLQIIFKKEELEPFLINLAPAVNKTAVNAKLSVENKKIIILQPAADAQEIDIDNTLLQFNQIIEQKQKEISIILEYTPALIREETLAQLGIVDQIGVGISNFKGSPASRITNIKIGLAKLNGVILKPQEEFSFNDLLGEVSAKQGYKTGYVIKDKKLVLEYGGGICQVSTTMFRSAVNSGLEITERNPHAFPVSYYNPQGFDATVYPPHPDLRFINNTPGNILIQGYASGTVAVFEFYGQDDGRRTEIKGPIIYQSNPDGSLKTVLTQSVFQGDELISEKKFYSNYKSPSLYPIEQNPLE